MDFGYFQSERCDQLNGHIQPLRKVETLYRLYFDALFFNKTEFIRLNNTSEVELPFSPEMVILFLKTEMFTGGWYIYADLYD